MYSNFLREMLEHLDFPMEFVNLVMECVTTPMFSLIVDGSMHGFFKSQIGLRQVDPMYHLLFSCAWNISQESCTKFVSFLYSNFIQDAEMLS